MKILRHLRGHSTTLNQIPIQMLNQLQLPCKLSSQINSPKKQKLNSRSWRKDPTKIANMIEQTLLSNQPILFHDLLEINLNDLTKILKLYLKYQNLSDAIKLSKRFEINELAYNLLFHIWISTDCFPSAQILLEKFEQLDIKPSEIYLLNLIKSLKRQHRYQEIPTVLSRMDEFKNFPFLSKDINKQDYKQCSKKFQLMLCDYTKSVEVCEYFYFPSFEMKASLIAATIYSRQYLTEFSNCLRNNSISPVIDLEKRIITSEIERNNPNSNIIRSANDTVIDYLEIFKELITHKVPISCYSRLISAFLSVSDHESATLIYEICLRHFKPNPYVIHPFIVYYIKNKDLSAGIKLYDSYLEKGGYPTTQLVSALMKLSINSDEIVRFYNQSRRFNSNIHYNLLFTHLLRKGDYSQLKITSDLNHYNYIELAKLLRQQKRTRRIVKLFQQMTENGITHSPTSFLLLLDSLSDRKEVSKIEYHIKQNQELSKQVFNQIVLIYAKTLQFEKAAFLLSKHRNLKTFLQVQAKCKDFSKLVEECDPKLESWYKQLFG